ESTLYVAAQTNAARARLAQAYGRLPLSFEANRGQTDNRVKFLSRGFKYTLFLAADEAMLALQAPAAGTQQSHDGPPQRTGDSKPRATNAVLRMKLSGANRNPQVIGTHELPGKTNYFIGRDP